MNIIETLHYIFPLFNILFSLIAIILVADFISGIGHWFEDVYGNPNWPLIGKYVVLPNIQHHLTPRSFLKQSYLYRNSTSFVVVIFIGVVFWILGLLSWQVGLLIAYLSQVNEVHAISHRKKSENATFIRFLQKIGLIQGLRHHGWHHAAPYDTNYCIMTEYLNPLLNKLKFWEQIESALKYIGFEPLRGTEIRNGM